MAHIVIDIKGQSVRLDAAEARRILCELRELLEADGAAGGGAGIPWTGTGYISPTGTRATPPYTLTTSAASGKYPNLVLNSDIFA